MKIYFLLVLTFSMLFNSCKNSPNKKSINKGTVSHSETFDKTLIDSLYLFTMQPSSYKEYYYSITKNNTKNRTYMERVIDQCNSEMTPYLIEKILDTAKTQTTYAAAIPLRVGDIAFELIQISDNRLNIPTVIFNEFKDSDLVWLDEIHKNKTYTYGNVYVPLFFKEPKFRYVNYKNRERIYLALKKQYRREN